MALFTENEELSRQGQRIPMDKVTGAKKVGLAMLGFKDTGERNKWGKYNPAMLLPGMSTLTNVAARGLSKGTDTNEVIREGTDEALSSDVAKLALAKDAALLIGTGGASGGLGLLKGLNKKKEMGDAQDNLDKGIDASTADINKMDPTSFESEDAYRSYWEGQGYSFDENGNLLDPDGNPASSSGGDTAFSGQKPLNKFGNTMMDIMGSGIPQSAMQVAATGAGYRKELEDKHEELNSRSRTQTFNYL